MPSPTSAIRYWTTIETFVKYVRIQTSVNVFRIEAIATTMRHRDRRERAEDEEEDDERSEAADQRLGEHARPAAAARRRLLDRIASGQVDGDAVRASPLRARLAWSR